MDDDGLAHLDGQPDLLSKPPALCLARGVVPVVVQAYLADGHRLGILREPGDIPDGSLVHALDVARVHAHRRVDARVGRREVQGIAARLQTGAHRNDVVHPLLDGALHHPLAVRLEGLVDEMGVGVHQHGQAVRIGQIGDDDLRFGSLPPLFARAVPALAPVTLAPGIGIPRCAVFRARNCFLPVLRAHGGFGFRGCIRPFRVFCAFPAPPAASASATVGASFSFRA